MDLGPGHRVLCVPGHRLGCSVTGQKEQYLNTRPFIRWKWNMGLIAACLSAFRNGEDTQVAGRYHFLLTIQGLPPGIIYFRSTRVSDMSLIKNPNHGLRVWTLNLECHLLYMYGTSIFISLEIRDEAAASELLLRMREASVLSRLGTVRGSMAKEAPGVQSTDHDDHPHFTVSVGCNGI